jgi:NAD(P)-dependent dehydrogenase (short-subunit alcohol dehydrogenase family)
MDRAFGLTLSGDVSVAWITGAGKGIGRSLALALAREGVCVAASARTREDLETLCEAAESFPGRVAAYPLDVTDRSGVGETIERIEADLGPIDLAVLNAGSHVPVNVDAFDPAVFRKLFDVNVMGVVHGLAAVLPRMLARKRGRIAVVSSVAGYRGLPTAAAYGATKAALINMCEALKPELDGRGIAISVVCPGFVRTPLTDRNPFPMPFLIEPEEAAARILRGLQRGQFEITFPRRFTWWLKLARCLPYWLYFAITRRLVRQHAVG